MVYVRTASDKHPKLLLCTYVYVLMGRTCIPTYLCIYVCMYHIHIYKRDFKANFLHQIVCDMEHGCFVFIVFCISRTVLVTSVPME